MRHYPECACLASISGPCNCKEIGNLMANQGIIGSGHGVAKSSHDKDCPYDPGIHNCTCGYYKEEKPNIAQQQTKPSLPTNQEFIDLLTKMYEIHQKKAQDYSAVGPDDNFKRSAEIGSWFINKNDKSFVILIGTKLARLATLLNSTKEPNFESLDDSFLDLATYCALWYANWKRRSLKEKKEDDDFINERNR